MPKLELGLERLRTQIKIVNSESRKVLIYMYKHSVGAVGIII